jgi:glycosyltransferase involved in cell wall biosynthesis
VAQSALLPLDRSSRSKPAAETVKLPLSAFIICMNEVQYLGNCVESLRPCREIIIVDSGSTDGTAEMVEDYIRHGWPIRFVHRDWPGYAAQKQFALDQCTQPWCLSIDADERLDAAFLNVLPQLLNSPPDVVGWRVARRPYLIGYGYPPPRVHERRILRLIRNGRGAFDQTLRVHEGIVPDGRVRDAKSGSLLHYRALPISEQILKENQYSTLKSEQWMEKGKGPRGLKLLFNPPLYFYRLYWYNGLWRCGFPGFIHAMTGAVYSFLTEAKIYQRYAEMQRPSFDDLDGESAESTARDNGARCNGRVRAA